MLANCQKEKTDRAKMVNTKQTKIADSINLGPETSMIKSKENTLKNLNDVVLETLRTKNYHQLSNYIHPKKGISFSMYAFVNPQVDKHFSREDFSYYLDKKTKFTWGEKDGSGDLLVLSLNDYLNDWVFKKNFTKGQYYLNEFKASGNSLNNLKKNYPNLDFTENYLPGTAEFGEMDWNCLRFVFDEFEGKNYIVAVINDQWTI